eukprot:scaffold232231_cov39-Attheya_sp.AAC.1
MIAGLIDPDEIDQLWQCRQQLSTVQTRRNGPSGHYLKRILTHYVIIVAMRRLAPTPNGIGGKLIIFSIQQCIVSIQTCRC